MSNEENHIFLGMFIAIMFIGMANLPALVQDNSNDDIYMRHIEQGMEVCEQNGGLVKIEGQTFSQHLLICENGAIFKYVPPKIVNDWPDAE